MKVIHLSYNDISDGAARAAYRIHKSLQYSNIDSSMMVIEKKSDDFSVINSTKKFNRILNKTRPYLSRILVKTLKTQNPIIHSPQILPSDLISKINNSDTDIINLHWIQNEMLSVKDIIKIKKPIVWTLHDMWAFCGAEHYTEDNRWHEGYYSYNRPSYESGFDLNKWTWQRKFKYWKKPLHIVTPSRWLSACVSKSKLMKNWPVSIIPYPIDKLKWKPIEKKIARKILDIPPDVHLILFGALGGAKDPRKGFDLLFDALQKLKLKNNFQNLELLIFGEDRPKHEMKFGFKTHYTGHLYDDLSLSIIYSAADVMVIPSRQDNLPNTGIESHACGTPVVSFNATGLPDIIEHLKTGYLAEAFDTDDLANGISWTLDPSNLNKLSKNARLRATTKFSEKNVSKLYLDIYNVILNK